MTTFGNADEAIDTFAVPPGASCAVVVEANFIGHAPDGDVTATAKVRETFFYDHGNDTMAGQGDRSGDVTFLAGAGWSVRFDGVHNSVTCIVQGGNAETVRWGVDVTYTVLRV